MGIDDSAKVLLPDTYRVQDACANCRHVFVRQEYDHGDEFFCTFAAPPRPPCFSVFMGEHGLVAERPLDYDEEGRERWDAWSEGRSVVPHGFCLDYGDIE